MSYHQGRTALTPWLAAPSSTGGLLAQSHGGRQAANTTFDTFQYGTSDYTLSRTTTLQRAANL